MKAWGLTNVKLQPFGPFGRGWTNDKFYMMATTPGGSFAGHRPSAGVDAGTTGAVSGDAVFATLDTPDDLATWKGKLKGKVLLATAMPRRPGALRGAGAALHRQEQLAALEARDRCGGRGGRGGGRRGPGPVAAAGRRRAFAQTRTQFLKDEGVLAILTPGRGTGGTVFVGGGGSREAERARRRCPASPSRSSTTAASSARCRRIAGDDRARRQEHLPRRDHVVQRHRRDPRHRQGRRGRHARRALRLLARAAPARPTTPPARR